LSKQKPAAVFLAYILHSSLVDRSHASLALPSFHIDAPNNRRSIGQIVHRSNLLGQADQQGMETQTRQRQQRMHTANLWSKRGETETGEQAERY